MAKIVFVDEDGEQKIHEASHENVRYLFRLAEILSEAELERLKRAVNAAVEHKANQLAQGK